MGIPTRVRGTMSACGARRDVVPSRECDYPPLARGVSKCAQHLLDGFNYYIHILIFFELIRIRHYITVTLQ